MQRAVCNLCGEVLPLGLVIRHLKEKHPDEYELADGDQVAWPDGGQIDLGWLESADPSDFDG